jgi:hypothetical protein
MKCSHGGCQTDATVTITPIEPSYGGAFDYVPRAEERTACRNHMAVLCEPDPLTGNSYFLVQPI